MPRRMTDREFIKNRYRWIANNAKGDATKLRATDRLAVLAGLLTISLEDQLPQSGKPPEELKIVAPDLDANIEKMFETFQAEE